MTQRDNPVKLHLKIKQLEAEIERLKQPCTRETCHYLNPRQWGNGKKDYV